MRIANIPLGGWDWGSVMRHYIKYCNKNPVNPCSSNVY